MAIVFIMCMKMMENILNMLLLLTMVLAIRRMSSKFKRSIKYAN